MSNTPLTCLCAVPAILCASAAAETPEPLAVCADALPLSCLHEMVKQPFPRTLEEAERYLAAGRLAGDDCVLPKGAPVPDVVPEAAWKNGDGWQALIVYVDGTRELVGFDEIGRLKPRCNSSWVAYSLDAASLSLTTRQYGTWKIPKAGGVLNLGVWQFDSRGQWMNDTLDIVFLKGGRLQEWKLRLDAEKPFSCKDDRWVAVGCSSYTMHSWQIDGGKLQWWRREDVPVISEEEKERQKMAESEDIAVIAPAVTDRRPTSASMMYFTEGKRISYVISEDFEKKTLHCSCYDARGVNTALLVYRNGRLDRKQSWFLQPRMDAANIEEKMRHARNDEERQVLKALYRFAPCAEEAEVRKMTAAAGTARVKP